jgi:hypothetical protein
MEAFRRLARLLGRVAMNGMNGAISIPSASVGWNRTYLLLLGDLLVLRAEVKGTLHTTTALLLQGQSK